MKRRWLPIAIVLAGGLALAWLGMDDKADAQSESRIIAERSVDFPADI